MTTAPVNLPPCPEGYKHANSGTFRKPKNGEMFINACSIDPQYHPDGIHPFAMKMTPNLHLDPDNPTEERWIIEPE